MDSKVFLDILSAFINNRKFDNKPQYDWEKIYNRAFINDVLGIVYCVASGCEGVPDDILKKLKKGFLSTAAISAKRDIIVSEVESLLTENNIEHMFIKGYVVKDYYPVKELRNMGDVDILIRENDREKCHTLLLNNGYTYDEYDSKKDVSNFVKSSIMFEMHSKLIGKNNVPNVDLMGYFADPFAHSQKNADGKTEINKEYHFIYLISHMAKHFVNGGFGVRMILDIPMFVNYYGDSIDWKYIFDELDGLGLMYFTQVIFHICGKYFDMPVPDGLGSIDIAQTDVDAVCDYMLDGGVFGYVGRNSDAIRVAKNAGSQNGKGASSYRVSDVLRWIFPSYEYMSERYVWFRGKPKAFLPFAWIYCIWYRLFKYRENSFSRIREALQSGDDAKKHSEIARLMGIGVRKKS